MKMIAFPVQDIQPRGTVQSFIPSYNPLFLPITRDADQEVKSTSMVDLINLTSRLSDPVLS